MTFVPGRPSGRPRSRGGGRRTAGRAAAGLLAAAALAGGPASGAAAPPPDASEILRRADEIRSPDLDYAVDFTLKVTNPASAWKERTGRYTLIARGKDYSLVLMREPAVFHPGTLLIMRGLYWMLLPKAGRPLQLTEQQILDGDVSNGDLARGNLARAYEPRLDGEEEVRGEPCWRLDLKRTSYEAFYPRIRAWIGKKRLQPRKLEYYGRTGTLLRTVHYEDYRKGPLGERAMRIEVGSHVRRAEASTLSFSNLRPLDASTLRFDVDGLFAFRDAARDILQTTGRQAEPEELLARLAGPARP